MIDLPKRYLGDGIYVVVTDGLVILTTEDGYTTPNTVVMEPEVLKSFLDYITAAAIFAARQL
jgi:hypothetical protein